VLPRAARRTPRPAATSAGAGRALRRSVFAGHYGLGLSSLKASSTNASKSIFVETPPGDADVDRGVGAAGPATGLAGPPAAHSARRGSISTCWFCQSSGSMLIGGRRTSCTDRDPAKTMPTTQPQRAPIMLPASVPRQGSITMPPAAPVPTANIVAQAITDACLA
jgi:hypothetical protein